MAAPALLSLILALPAMAEEPGVRRGPMVPFGSSMPDQELYINPDFEAETVLQSVAQTLDAASTCVAKGSGPLVTPRTFAPNQHYFDHEQLDGEALDIWSRSAEYSCHARPVRRCNFQYVWDEAHSTLAHASVQCLGSEEGKMVSYIVTLTRDVEHPKKKKKGRPSGMKTSLNFYTDAFPGTNTWINYTVDGVSRDVTYGPAVITFDDYNNHAAEQFDVFSHDEVRQAGDQLLQAVCHAVAHKSCVSAEATNTADIQAEQGLGPPEPKQDVPEP